jgi:glycosyltransferase involved in cell wall biosynthesis
MGAFGHFAWLAARRAASIEQDLVVASSTPLSIAIPAVYAARRRRVPMVFEVRDLWPAMPIALGALRSPITRRVAWQLERWAYRHSNQVIALSPAISHSIRGRFPGLPVTVISNGCDLDLFADAERAGVEFRTARPWLGTRPFILYAGSFGTVNGVGYVVRMAASLKATHPDIRIAVVGRGREEAQLRNLAQRLGVLDHNLFMLDPVSKSNVVGLFGACDLALATAIDKPALQMDSANKVFDAFAAARPVAVNHEGQLADLLRRSGAGIVMPAADPHAAAVIVADFLGDSARTEAARMAAAHLARAEFSRDLLFNRFERVLLRASDTSDRVRCLSTARR